MAEYNLERMASHGERRAAEMEEIAATLRELGLDPLMAEATVQRQREMGAIGKAAPVRKALDSRGPRRHARAPSARPRSPRIDFLNARSCCRAPLRTQNPCQHCELEPYYVRSIQLREKHNEPEETWIRRPGRGDGRRHRDRLGRAERSENQEEGRGGAGPDALSDRRAPSGVRRSKAAPR